MMLRYSKGLAPGRSEQLQEGSVSLDLLVLPQQEPLTLTLLRPLKCTGLLLFLLCDIWNSPV